MNITPEEQAALDRIPLYNINYYDAVDNPYGFGEYGHEYNLIPSLNDVRIVGLLAKRISEIAIAGVERMEAATEAIEQGPVSSVNGLVGNVIIPALAPVLKPMNNAPTLLGGALILSVVGFLPLYPKAQKSIQFQVSTSNAFGSTVFDSGAVLGQMLSVGVPNAQNVFTGGSTYYVRSRQTDVDDFTSDWSSVTSFVFPRAPNAAAMSAPANNATNVGAQNASITLTAAAYSHPNGIAQAARRFELSKDNFATIVTVNGTIGQVSATLASPRDSLTAGTIYKVRCVDTDVNGGVGTGTATQFTTTAQYKPLIGEAYNGGFLAFENFGDGLLYDLVLASKSTEASKQFDSSTTDFRAFSRVSGDKNTDKYPTASTQAATGYARSITIGGTAGYLGAIDEWRAISSKLKPSAAQVAAFQSGGAEILDSVEWSSTEFNSSNALSCNVPASSEASEAKTSSRTVRALRRIAVTPPYPIGTAMEGGYLAAYFTDVSSGSPVTYMLIIADKAIEVTRTWASGSSGTNASAARQSRTNGPSNAQDISANSGATGAAYYCDDLSSGGKTDWYLGAVDELLAVYRMNSQLPSAQQLSASIYWSSTEITASTAKSIKSDGSEDTATSKTASNLVRPIRRVLLPS